MKTQWTTLVALLCLPMLWAGSAKAAGTASPSSFTVARGQSNTVVVTYVFSGLLLPAGTITAPEGIFAVGGTEVERTSQPITISIRAGAGAGSETIVVPVRVIERALQRGSRTFTFTRQFLVGPAAPVPIPITVDFSIGSEATASFGIRRIELYFENRRPETTVPKDFPKLKAFADLNFVGSGFFQGYWEVDGRILAQVNQHLSFGPSITLQTPEVPPLPTFDPGTHTVRFIVTSPSYGIPLPAIIYFVTPDEHRRAPRPLKLLAPEDRQAVPAGPVTFTWEPLSGTALHLVQFFPQPDAKPVFSAYAQEGTYTLPLIVLEEIFTPEQTYHWKVIGFDEQSRTIGESPLRAFTPGNR